MIQSYCTNESMDRKVPKMKKVQWTFDSVAENKPHRLVGALTPRWCGFAIRTLLLLGFKIRLHHP